MLCTLIVLAPTGYGYDGRVSQLCPKGTYNPGDNYATCTQCDYGLTTQAPGAGITVADCGLAPGFGQINGSAKPCPIGKSAAAGSKTCAASVC